MKTPEFWQYKNTLSTLLLPCAWLYGAGVWLRRLVTRPMTLPVPVICVGNLTTGGAGKTPVALHIGKKLRQKGINAFFLSRGYGGSLRGAVAVDPQKHSAAEVGDEPLLLVQVLPTVVAKNRESGARLAVAQGARVIVMDDGFQNPSIEKTVSFVVIDGQIGFGNGRLLPAGPLREPPLSGLARANAIIIINAGHNAPQLSPDEPVLHARTQASDNIVNLKGKKIIAFCGLAYPQKFFVMLEDAGALLHDNIAFADHHAFTKADLETLSERAHKDHAQLVTTAKDAMRLPHDFRKQVTVIDITLDFADEERLDNILDFTLPHHGKN